MIIPHKCNMADVYLSTIIAYGSEEWAIIFFVSLSAGIGFSVLALLDVFFTGIFGHRS